MSTLISIALIILYLYRCVLSVLAHTVVRGITKLGDSGVYQHESYVDYYTGTIFDPTLLTMFVGYIISDFLFDGPVFINIAFQTIAFVGIFLFIRTLSGANRVLVLILVATPSFSLWSSVAGKEAIIVFLVFTILSQLVRWNDRKISFFYLGLVLLSILWIYKPSYFPALLYLISMIVISRFVRQKAFLSYIAVIISLFMMYVFKDTISEYSFAVSEHFSHGIHGLSTREPYWHDTYDVFFKAPYGMFQSFFGPTFSEVSNSVLHLFSFVESLVILIILMAIVLVRLPRLPVFIFITATFSLVMILFVNYPFGIMNPGSAIRYRTGYFPIVIFIIINH